MATIQDVARLANVSVSSVSNVLNGRAERMRQDTFVRIEQAGISSEPNRSTPEDREHSNFGFARAHYVEPVVRAVGSRYRAGGAGQAQLPGFGMQHLS